MQPEGFEARVRSRMGARGWSLSRLAREARVQRATLYAWFAGHQRPEVETLARVAAVLETTPEELLGGPVPTGDLAAALSALAAELREWRLEDRERIEALERALVALGSRLPPPGGEASAAPPVHRERAGR